MTHSQFCCYLRSLVFFQCQLPEFYSEMSRANFLFLLNHNGYRAKKEKYYHQTLLILIQKILNLRPIHNCDWAPKMLTIPLKLNF